MEIVDIEKTDEIQCIIGQAGFIKTIEDLYEALVSTSSTIKFGVAFSEASGDCLIRSEGNDNELVKMAESNAFRIGAGHSFIILFKGAYPINIVNSIKMVSEVSRIICATANPIQCIIADTEKGRAILGIVDGSKPKGIEAEADRKNRKKLLRDIGYKL